jgi:RHS repeat-associated protein
VSLSESVTQADNSKSTISTKYTYDALNRLSLEETYGTGGDRKTEYVMDLVGNRTSKTVTIDYYDTTVTNYSYDSRDRLLTEVTGSETMAFGYDANGSLTTQTKDGVLQSTQVWDARGRLVGLKVGNNTTAAEYTYTPSGIRSSVSDTKYIIDSQSASGYAQVVEELDLGIVVANFVYGSSLDPLSQWRSGGQGSNLYLGDGHSGVRQGVSLAGVVLLAQRFDAYGATLTTTGTLSNVIGYRGERFDGTLGQYYLRATYYDPRQGRFMAQDPYAGTYNDPLQAMRYGYAGGNPVLNKDPSGLITLTGLKLGIKVQISLKATLSVSVIAAATTFFALRPEPGISILYSLASQLGAKVATDKDEVPNDTRQTFVHGSSSGAWDSSMQAIQLLGSSKQDFGLGFYTYEDNPLGRIAAVDRSYTARTIYDGIAFIMVVAVSDRDMNTAQVYDLRGPQNFVGWERFVSDNRKFGGLWGHQYDVITGPVAGGKVDKPRPIGALPDQYAFVLQSLVSRLKSILIIPSRLFDDRLI